MVETMIFTIYFCGLALFVAIALAICDIIMYGKKQDNIDVDLRRRYQKYE